MNGMLYVMFVRAKAASLQRNGSVQKSTDTLFHARAQSLDGQRPDRLYALKWVPIPVTFAAKVAAYRAERELRANIKRLEELSSHLLADIDVEKDVSGDFLVRTDDMKAVVASAQADADRKSGHSAQDRWQGLSAVSRSV